MNWFSCHFQTIVDAVTTSQSAARPTANCWFVTCYSLRSRVLRAECIIPEICAITGHSLQSATTVLKHYLELGEPLAREAIRKMVEWMEREGVKL